MNFLEAVKAIKEGKKVTINNFKNTCLAPNSIPTLRINNRFVELVQGRLVWNVTEEMTLSNDWEIIDEDKDWNLWNQQEEASRCEETDFIFKYDDIKKLKKIVIEEIGEISLMRGISPECQIHNTINKERERIKDIILKRFGDL